VDELEVEGYRVPRIHNEFWTSRQRQGHSLHEISYRACFKSELPASGSSASRGPATSSSTPSWGAARLCSRQRCAGAFPYGFDLNPLSRILLLPRLDPPELPEIEDRLRRISQEQPIERKDPQEPDLTPFYEEQTLAEIRRLRHWFRIRSEYPDRIDRWLRMIATNRLSGHSSGFFSGRTMPPNQAITPDRQRRLNEKSGELPPRRDLVEIMLKKSRTLLRDVRIGTRETLLRIHSQAKVETADAEDPLPIEPASVQLTVTSPPFLDVIDYAGDNWLRCWFNGIDPQSIAARVKSTRDLESWSAAMERVFEQLFVVTCPGGWVVFEVGEVRRGTIALEESVLPVAIAAGFEPICVAVQVQDFTKTANCWGISNNQQGTNTQRMVVLRRPQGSHPSGSSGDES
jgi:hypothetical protein